MTVSLTLAPQMPVAFPIEVVIDDDALGRPNDAVGRRQKVAGQRLGIGIDQPGLAVEPLAVLGIARAVGLKMIKLAGARRRERRCSRCRPSGRCSG